jgi:SulP family sulfate permease
VALGSATIAAILVLRRLTPRIPGMVLVVALASVAAALALPSVETVGQRYGSLPKGIPRPSCRRSPAADSTNCFPRH